ncbi:MAG: DUF554 domain-containing protein [Limnochordaceae bacterium]|nr:DUF554 domain-containing protein [Limnochordaceae bacterium]
MLGTWINVALVLGGASIGLMARRVLPERWTQTMMRGVGLFVLYVGADMAAQLSRPGQRPILALLSLAGGALVGEALQLEDRLRHFAKRLEQRWGGTHSQHWSQGFVAASLLFVVGPMAILGSIQDGTTGDYRLLLTKGLMDGIAAVAFASTLGPGVLASALAVLVYQGGITLAAHLVAAGLTSASMGLLTGTGGLIIVGLGLNLLGLEVVPVTNLLPALPLALAFPGLLALL